MEPSPLSHSRTPRQIVRLPSRIRCGVPEHHAIAPSMQSPGIVAQARNRFQTNGRIMRVGDIRQKHARERERVRIIAAQGLRSLGQRFCARRCFLAFENSRQEFQGGPFQWISNLLWHPSFASIRSFVGGGFLRQWHFA